MPLDFPGPSPLSPLASAPAVAWCAFCERSYRTWVGTTVRDWLERHRFYGCPAA